MFRHAVCSALILLCWSANGQDRNQIADSTIVNPDSTSRTAAEIFAEVDSLLTTQDSLAVFQIIDSLLNLPEPKETSQMAVRLAYNSNIVATGRTLGINKFGLSSGVAYYHKSGFYADVSGYWSREYDPDYYLTIGTAGFMVSPVKRWTLMTEYSRYFYTDTGQDVSVPYKNNAGLSNFVNFKYILLRLDYYLYFGEKTGHRLMPGFNLNFEKRHWKGIDRILFYPNFYVLLGSEQISNYQPYTTRFLEIVYRIRHNLPLYYETTNTEFGVMNYSFSAPLSVTSRNWNFLISYTYNIPKALPGEQLSLTNGGYGSLTITRYFNFK